MDQFMALDVSIVLIATLSGFLALVMLLCLRISGQCTRVVQMAKIASQAEAITEARRLALEPALEESSPHDGA